MITLYNQSGVPNSVMQPLLLHAKAMIECEGKVAIKVSKTRWTKQGSHARRIEEVRSSFMRSKIVQNRKADVPIKPYERKVQSDGGYTVITPLGCYVHDPLKGAKEFFETSMHELYHIKEYQEKNFNFSGLDGKPRPVWKKRPEEIRAQAAEVKGWEKALSPENKEKTDKLIEELAIEFAKVWARELDVVRRNNEKEAHLKEIRIKFAKKTKTHENGSND